MDDLHKFYAFGDPLHIINELHQNAKFGGLHELRAQNPMPYMLGCILRKLSDDVLAQQHEQHIQYLPAWLTAPAYWYANTDATLALLKEASKSPHPQVRMRSKLFLRRAPPEPVSATTCNPIHSVSQTGVMRDQHAIELWTVWYMTGDEALLSAMVQFMGKNAVQTLHKACADLPSLDAFNAKLQALPRTDTLDDAAYQANVRRIVLEAYGQLVDGGPALKRIAAAVKDPATELKTLIGFCARSLAVRDIQTTVARVRKGKTAGHRADELFITSYVLDDVYKQKMDILLLEETSDTHAHETSALIYQEVAKAGRRKRADERLVELKIEKRRMAKFTKGMEQVQHPGA